MYVDLRGSTASDAPKNSYQVCIYTETDGWTDPCIAIWNDTRLTAISIGVTVKLVHTMADGGLTETVNNSSGMPFGTGLTLPFTYRAEPINSGVGAAAGYRHFVRLADFTDGLLAAVTEDTGLAYEDLTGDMATLEISVTGTLTDGKTLGCSLHPAVCRIPDYTITSVALDDPNTIVIEYTATTGWDRADSLDRARLRNFTVNGTDAIRIHGLSRETNPGFGNEYGRLYIPRIFLSRFPRVGNTVSVTISSNLDHKYTYIGTLANEAECDTPEWNHWIRDGYIEISPWSSGDKGYTGTELYSIAIEGGEYSCDAVSGIAEEGTAYLYPPLDVECTYTITGYSEDGDVSASVSFTETIPSDGLVYIGTDNLTMRYNLSYREDRSPESERIKLARELPSVYYGTGFGSANISISGDIDRSEQTADSFRALAREISLYRIPGGRRAYCAVKTVQVQEHALYDSISMSLYEVGE